MYRITHYALLSVAAAVALLPNTPSEAQTPAVRKEPADLQFNFSGAAWRTVIEWLADSADLALHVNDLPLGSFTYSDSKRYTSTEAIHRVNQFLIPQRYTLVRSGRLLTVISLDDETSVRQLDSLARMVQPAELAQLDRHDFVKCVFPLDQVSASQAMEELAGLLLAREPVVMPNSNQLLVMDTAAKLRVVDDILRSLNTPSAVSGPVKHFALGDLDPDSVLVQIRPHVGLDSLAMTGADIRLSIDKERGQLLASGSSENLRTIANVIALLKDADSSAGGLDAKVFRPHKLGAADMQTVTNVLQTLLAEEDVRMAADARSNQLVILAKEHVHELVEETIGQLTGTTDDWEFKSIAVRGVDARYAAVILNDMFGARMADESDAADAEETPRIDVDSAAGRLFIRARASQLREIEAALEQIGRQPKAASDKVKYFRHRGERVDQLLERAQRLWPYPEGIEVVPPARELRQPPVEREVRPLDPGAPRPRSPQPSSEPADGTVAHLATHPTSRHASRAGTYARSTRFEQSQPSEKAAADIRVQPTPDGLLIQSDDAEAVQRFEQHLSALSADSRGRRRLAVFYLQHALVEDANPLLQQLLAEERFDHVALPRSASPGILPSNVIDIAGGSGNWWSYNDTSILPDRRLNRFFVYGDAAALASVEDHLEIIDRENSITQMRTHGSPRVIALRYARAAEVAEVVRAAYATRVANVDRRPAPAARPASAQREDDPDEEDEPAARRERRNSRPVGNEEVPMTLAVDEQSNSLIVTAPSQLAEEVSDLVKLLDQRGAQTVQMMRIPGGHASQVGQALQQLLGTPPARNAPARRNAPSATATPRENRPPNR